MSLPLPDEFQATSFAVMIQSGLPPAEAILYFVESDDSGELAQITQKWLRSNKVRNAILDLMGKPWHEMSTDERAKDALDTHYNQLSYFLKFNHYSDMNSTEKAKADTARTALEAKLAGTAGKTDELTRFFDDMRSGKLKLGAPYRPS